ncbi:glycosyltransferase [Rhodococcus sp. NPDC127528]|uniref:glycosyltransferase n=1 Tax=unclassified Rhodococcus (in: high G+C Gram-positive bacteria) TaxID=192944 RepID=UPI00362566E3
MSRLLRAVVRSGTVLSAAGAVVATVNARTVPRLSGRDAVSEPVTVCVPARNEADSAPRLIADLRAQRGLADLRVLVLDDDSTDGTGAAVRDAIGGDPRFTLHRHDGDPPPGWVGKPAACARLAELSADRSGVLVFLDADVRLAPDALAAAVGELRTSGADLLCPWPFQTAVTAAERAVQPLLCWSWFATAPVPVANRTTRPSMAVACGQFLVFDAHGYRAVGSHHAVAGSVAEDLDLARVLRRSGRLTAVAAAGELARCRMYDGPAQARAGHGRWLWTAFGSPAGASAVLAAALSAYLAPPLAAAFGRGSVRRWGLAGYGCAVASRLVARRTESGGALTARDGVDALAHPLSVIGLAALTVDSHLRHRRGGHSWKGRPLRHP